MITPEAMQAAEAARTAFLCAEAAGIEITTEEIAAIIVREYEPVVAERDLLAEANKKLVEALVKTERAIRWHEIKTLTRIRAALPKPGGKT